MIRHLSFKTRLCKLVPLRSSQLSVIGSPKAATCTQTSIPPRYAPKSINFTDTCPTRNCISGDAWIECGYPDGATPPDYWRVYFADSNGNLLDDGFTTDQEATPQPTQAPTATPQPNQAPTASPPNGAGNFFWYGSMTSAIKTLYTSESSRVGPGHVITKSKIRNLKVSPVSSAGMTQTTSTMPRSRLLREYLGRNR